MSSKNYYVISGLDPECILYHGVKCDVYTHIMNNFTHNVSEKYNDNYLYNGNDKLDFIKSRLKNVIRDNIHSLINNVDELEDLTYVRITKIMHPITHKTLDKYKKIKILHLNVFNIIFYNNDKELIDYINNNEILKKSLLKYHKKRYFNYRNIDMKDHITIKKLNYINCYDFNRSEFFILKQKDIDLFDRIQYAIDNGSEFIKLFTN